MVSPGHTVQAPGTPPAADTARVFLALRPGLAVRAALGEHVRDWQWPAQAQPYCAADWHVTLHFIGSVHRSRLPALRAGLDEAVTPFELRFGEPALWPHGLAVLLPMSVPTALQRLHAQLGQRLRQLDLRPDERSYRPHLTLARRATHATLPARFPAWGWPVRGYALMASTGDTSQRYRVLQHYGESDDDLALLR